MALTPDKTRYEQGLKICEKIIPWGAVWSKNYGSYKKGDKFKADRKLSSGTGKVGGITIHNTDGGANAETYTRATYPNQNMKDCRVHYYVDDVEAWQNLQEYEVGWHAGDGRGNGNETTLSIEIIMRGKAIANDAKSEKNGALLAAILLHRHGLGIDKLYKHQDWSGKYCPAYILPHWAEFKTKVQAYLNKIKAAEQAAQEKPTESGKTLYRVQVGAYAVKENADAQLKKVKAAGFTDAYITKTTTN